MLVMTRRIGESVRIGDNIIVTVTDIDGSQIKLGIEAPREISILRDEAKKVVASPSSPRLGSPLCVQPLNDEKKRQ